MLGHTIYEGRGFLEELGRGKNGVESYLFLYCLRYFHPSDVGGIATVKSCCTRPSLHQNTQIAQPNSVSAILLMFCHHLPAMQRMSCLRIHPSPYCLVNVHVVREHLTRHNIGALNDQWFLTTPR